MLKNHVGYGWQEDSVRPHLDPNAKLLEEVEGNHRVDIQQGNV